MKLLVITGSQLNREIRIRKMQEHLPKHGWEATVIDRAINLPRGAGKLNEAFRMTFLEDSSTAWAITKKAEILRTIREQKPDAIMTSCPPFSTAIFGALLKTRTGIPYIIDYRDPWSFNEARGWESPIHRKATLLEEGWTDGKADRIVQVGKAYAEKYLEEFPRTPAGKVVEIPNGYDPEDYQNLKPRQYDRFTIGWVGTLWGDADLTFLKTYATMCNHDKKFREDTQLEIAGQVFPRPRKEILQTAQHLPVHVHGLLPRQEALEITAGCHLLVYCGIERMGKLDLASRIYEYAAIGQNTIAVSNPEGELANVLDTTKAGRVIPFQNQRLGLTEAYYNLWYKWRSGEDIKAKKDPEGLKKYDRREAVAKLAETLDQIMLS